MEMRELENTEVSPPAELPAVEPVGMELLAPRGNSVGRKRKREDAGVDREKEEAEAEAGNQGGNVRFLRIPGGGDEGDGEEDDVDVDVDWPLPMSPLQQIFKSTEMRDGKAEEVKHETYYHP